MSKKPKPCKKDESIKWWKIFKWTLRTTSLCEITQITSLWKTHGQHYSYQTRTDSSASSVLIPYNIFQHTGVNNRFQTALFTKTPALKKKGFRVTSDEAINACVLRWAPQLTANGLRPSTKPAFYWAFCLWSVHILPQGRCGNFGLLETRGIFVVLYV